MSHCSPTSSTTCVTSGRRTSWRRQRREEMDHRLQLKFLFIFTIEKWIRVFGNCVCDWQQAHVFNRTFNLLYTIWISLILFVSTSPQRQHCISLLDSSMRRGIGATPNCQKALWVGIKTCFFRTKSSNFGMFSWWSMVMAMALFSGQWIVQSVEFAWFYVCIGLQRCLVFARLIWRLCKRHRCRQTRGKLANPWPNFIRSSVHSKRCNFDIWRPGVDWIGLISKLVSVYQCLWPCTVTRSIVTNTSTQIFQASHTHLQKALDTSQAQLIGRSSTPLDRRLVDTSTLDMVWRVRRSLSQNEDVMNVSVLFLVVADLTLKHWIMRMMELLSGSEAFWRSMNWRKA